MWQRHLDDQLTLSVDMQGEWQNRCTKVARITKLKNYSFLNVKKDEWQPTRATKNNDDQLDNRAKTVYDPISDPWQKRRDFI